MVMNEQRPRFVYLTLPEAAEPVLNVGLDTPADAPELHRYALTREQMIKLNAELAAAIWKGMAR
jgi:hypothetical protein